MREGIPSGEMDIKFSTPFHDEQEPLPRQVEFLGDEKSLAEREVEHSLEIGLNFQDVRVDVTQEQKVRSRRFSLLDQIKNRSLILASVLGIHVAPILLGDPEIRSSMLEKAREMIASVQFGEKEQQELASATKLLLEKDVKNFIRSSTESEGNQELALQKLEDLHLKVLELKAGISPEEKAKTKEYIDGLRTKYTELHKKNILSDGSTLDHTLAELFEFSKDTGRYESEMARLSDIANKGAGNCESKALIRRLILPRIFPGNEMKFQHFGPGEQTAENQGPTDTAGHIRTIMKIQGNWYALEDGTPKKLSPEDLTGTQITDIDIFERSLLGEKVGSKPVKSLGEVPRQSTFKTNSLYSIQFEHPPTRSAPAGFSTQAETADEYAKRQRLQYAAGGNIIDPENLPPLKLYIGDTLEEVASQMGGSVKKENNPNEKVALPEYVRMNALVDGRLDLLGASQLYDLSSLQGVDVHEVNVYDMSLKNSDRRVKIFEDLHEKFPNLTKIHGYVMTEKEAVAFQKFTSLENVSLFLGEKVSDINFLLSNESLKDVSIVSYSSEKVSLEPFREKNLEKINLINTSDKGIFTHFDAIDPTNLVDVDIPITSKTNEGESLITSSPHLEKAGVEISGEAKAQSFLDNLSFQTHELQQFIFESRTGETFQFDLKKLSGQPLTFLKIGGGFVTNLEALHGMPLRDLQLNVDCDASSLSSLKSLNQLQRLTLICSGEVPVALDTLVHSLGIKEVSVRSVFDTPPDTQYGVINGYEP